MEILKQNKLTEYIQFTTINLSNTILCYEIGPGKGYPVKSSSVPWKYSVIEETVHTMVTEEGTDGVKTKGQRDAERFVQLFAWNVFIVQKTVSLKLCGTVMNCKI